MIVANKTSRVIIDTNVWISFLIGKSMQYLLQYIIEEQIIIVTCKEQLIELLETVEKPKLKKYFKSDQVATFFSFLDEYATVIPVTTTTNLCRDTKDDYLLSLSIDAKAHYLVTGDNDLLILKRINNTIIVNYTNFEKIISNSLNY
jgi:putative PIN family toxin of toxin-antitoxin system